MESNLGPNGTLSPEQWAFLSKFSANYVAGRRMLCWTAHAIVAVGAVVGALAAIIAAYAAVWPR